jgi:subtilisin family serine protease
VSSLRRLALVLPAFLGSLTLLSAAGTSASSQAAPDAAGPLVEVVVTLPQPPLAEAIRRDRGLAARATSHRRLDLRAPASVSYLRTLASAQRRLQARIENAIPGAEVHWRYGVVLDGMAVVVPRSQVGRLAAVRGATVWPSLTYHALLNRTPQLIGAPAVWGPTLATAGNGMKIGILDDGLDQTHVFFDASGYDYPPGFPKGNTAYTTPKVIVAKTFAPRTPAWKYANTPFDPEFSDHATNVAGIAAGDHDTLATVGGAKIRVSGIAPRAYLGNYKVLTTPTQSFGLDGNSPEIARGIEEAVKDGMDVINLSLGEPEIEPSRDIVVQAIDNAADAGVITAVAAGNDFTDTGRGSIGSPGTAPKAITVAASTEGDSGPADVIADFSSSGPTPISLQLKPDVTAPGVDLLSSLPRNQWSNHDWSGTSMATPHVAAAAALLKERHPAWTPAEVKSALESTGAPVRPAGSATEISALREGGGRIDVAQADDPLVFTDPSSLSFGLVRRGTTAVRQLALADAGGGAAPWAVSVDRQTAPSGVSLSVSAPVAAAGSSLGVTLAVAADAAEGDGEGFLLLSRGTEVRRVPFWLHVEVPKLGTEKHATLLHPGVYGGNTAGKPARVSSYRYPEGPLSCNCPTGVQTNQSGPEQVFRYTLKRPVANLGAVVLSRARGVRVSPRLVTGDDENRLVGYTAIPVDINPYADYGRVVPAVGAAFPAPAAYDVVFDTPAGAKPGRFTFRFWVNDVTPPRVRLLTRTVRPHRKIRLRVTDAGAGVDPASLVLRLGGSHVRFAFKNGLLTFSSGTLARGAHRLTLVAADYQETKNMENTGPVLPNTRTFHATVVVR